MNSMQLVSVTLLVASLSTGCTSYNIKQSQVSATTDLNWMNTSWYGTESVDNIVSQSYLITDVHYSMIGPSSNPSTSGPSTAILVNTGGISTVASLTALTQTTNENALKILEFGQGGALTSTENEYSEPWAQMFNGVGSVYAKILRERGFDSIVDVGNDSILGWGRWTDSRYKSGGSLQAGCCDANKSAHYVFGAATPNANIANTGLVATFNLIGATAPTISDGSSAPGTLTSGTVAVSFNGATTNTRMGVNLAGTLNNLPFTVQSPGTTLTPTIPYDPATRSFTMTNSIVDGSSISGFLAGPTASHVGLTYATPRGPNLIQGAAAFKQ